MNDYITHEKFMQRCLFLALKGKGNVEPNPLVGSVIVHKGKIIGEGYHKEYGKAHAEVNAINSVKDKSLLEQSIIYVNLEPCSHHGKTPPCSDLIVKHKIPNVVVGTIDTNIEIGGKGIAKLKNSGAKAITGILEDKCRKINSRFFTFHEKKRPYIILKWAESKDGFIDIDRKDNEKKGVWLTNETCRVLVHKWRAEEASILIGKNTALLDNPSLNIRSWYGKDPVRIIIDKDASLPANLKIFDNSIKTICYTNNPNQDMQNIIFQNIDFTSNSIQNILQDLYTRNISSVFVEGGTKTINQFINVNLWDEARIFIGDKTLVNGIKGPTLNTNIHSETIIGNSLLKILLNNI